MGLDGAAEEADARSEAGPVLLAAPAAGRGAWDFGGALLQSQCCPDI